MTIHESSAEYIAHKFHETYGKVCAEHGISMAIPSRKPWETIPRNHQILVIDTVRELLDTGVIEVPDRMTQTG